MESNKIYQVELEYGAVYTGEVTTDITLRLEKQIAHGSGELVYANGDKYIGQFYYGQPEGTGTLIASSSYTTHTGLYKEGKAHGHGTLYHQNGYLYEGPFKNGVPDGNNCHERLANGSTFFGTFSQGQKNGFGVMKFYDGC